MCSTCIIIIINNYALINHGHTWDYRRNIETTPHLSLGLRRPSRFVWLSAINPDDCALTIAYNN